MDVFGQRQAPTTDGRMGLKDVHGDRGVAMWKPRFCLGCWAAWTDGKQPDVSCLSLLVSPFPNSFLWMAVMQNNWTSSQRFSVTLIIFFQCAWMVRQSHPLLLGAACKYPALNHSDNLVGYSLLPTLPTPFSFIAAFWWVHPHPEMHIGEEMLVLQCENKGFSYDLNIHCGPCFPILRKCTFPLQG